MSETVTLFGLPIVDGRTIGVGRIDPALAREMFIRHALVAGGRRTGAYFDAQGLTSRYRGLLRCGAGQLGCEFARARPHGRGERLERRLWLAVYGVAAALLTEALLPLLKAMP